MADAYSTKIYQQLVGGVATKNYQHLSASASATSAVTFYGPVWFGVSGDFGGGTAQVQHALSASAQFVDIAGTSATAAADKRIDFPPGSRNYLKVTLTGGAAASADIVLQGFARENLSE
jgi:hypothetical protein